MNWQNLFSTRAWWGTILILAIVYVLFGLIWKPLGIIAAVIVAPLVLYAQVAPENVLYCPFCRKRVKSGASACHHCGRSVT